MFTATDLQTRLRRQPFVPLRIGTSGGETYDIIHPDFVFVSRRYLEVWTANPDEPGIPDQVQLVSMLHITSVKDIPAAPAVGANGVPAAGSNPPPAAP